MRAAVQKGAMVQRRVCAVIPCSDTGPWEAQAGMDTGAAIGVTQYRTQGRPGFRVKPGMT